VKLAIPLCARGAADALGAESVNVRAEKYTALVSEASSIYELNDALTTTPVGTLSVTVTAEVPGDAVSTSSTGAAHRNSSPY